MKNIAIIAIILTIGFAWLYFVAQRDKVIMSISYCTIEDAQGKLQHYVCEENPAEATLPTNN